MSNTAYQRGMKDMRKAGLNPILAYKQGGASSPVAGVPVMSGGSDDVMGLALKGQEVSTAKKTAKKTRGVLGATKGMLGSQQAKLESSAAVDRATANKVMADTGHVTQQTRRAAADADISEFNKVRAGLDAGFYSTARGKFSNELNKWINNATGAIGFGLGRITGGSLKPGRRSYPNRNRGIPSARERGFNPRRN